jgi:hypothetical protein
VPAAGLAQPPPTDVATGAATPSETSAEVLGYFNYGSTYPPGIPNHCWFDYGTTLDYGSRTDAICSGTTKATLTPLVPGTTYHYRAAASNEAGITYGPDKSFPTLGSAPPPPGSPPPEDKVGATMKVLSRHSLRSVLRSGLRLRVAVTGACPCDVRARLLVSRTTARRLGLARFTTIARRSGKLAAPGTVSLTLRLKARANRRLRHARTLKATARVTVTGASGSPVAISRAVSLRSAG